MKKLCLLVIFCFVGIIKAQSTPKETVDLFFQAMEENDTLTLKKICDEKIRMVSLTVRQGKEIIHEGSFEEFIKGLDYATKNYPNLKEVLLEYKIENNGFIANVFTPYKFLLDTEKNQVSHCGDNNFQLIKQENGTWKIYSIYDTRVNCEE